MTTGVIYARVSSIGDRQSTERQVKDLSEYAKYKGIEVCKVFEEQLTLSGQRRTSVPLCPDNDSHAFNLCAIGT